MMPFEDNPPKAPMVSRLYLGWSRASDVHSSHILGQLSAHGEMSIRRNHIDCQARKNEYKKLGGKRPGLRMGDYFVIFGCFFFPGNA